VPQRGHRVTGESVDLLTLMVYANPGAAVFLNEHVVVIAFVEAV
jgi:hypothetical protein